MNERIVVSCKGLFISKTNGRYREIISLEFLTLNNGEVNEQETLNPVMIEDCMPKSMPGDAIQILEQRLPVNLFMIENCFKPMLQDNNLPFVYKGRKYMFIDNTLHRVIEGERVE